jgi:hypothetical protein
MFAIVRESRPLFRGQPCSGPGRRQSRKRITRCGPCIPNTSPRPSREKGIIRPATPPPTPTKTSPTTPRNTRRRTNPHIPPKHSTTPHSNRSRTSNPHPRTPPRAIHSRIKLLIQIRQTSSPPQRATPTRRDNPRIARIEQVPASRRIG